MVFARESAYLEERIKDAEIQGWTVVADDKDPLLKTMSEEMLIPDPFLEDVFIIPEIRYLKLNWKGYKNTGK